MKKCTDTLFLIFMVTTLLNTACMSGMQTSDITYSSEEYKQQAKEAHEYNQNNLFPDETFEIIFSHCKKENDIIYIPALERNTYTGEAKSAIITYCQMQTLLNLNITCTRFNKLMPFKKIIAFCKTLPKTIKDNTLQITIPNIDKNYVPSKWTRNYDPSEFACLVISVPKFNNNYDNNLICSVLLHAGANSNTKYQVTDKIKLNRRYLSVISQAIHNAPFLVEAALNHGADPNEKDSKGIPLFFYAKTVEMANLFLINDCHKHGKSANNTNVIWHILDKNYPPELITFYLENHVNILTGGRTIVHDFIDVLEDYVDYGLANEFLEKCKILLGAILESSKNRILEHCTLLDELKKQFDHVQMKGKDVQEFKNTTIKLFKEHGCKTAYDVICEQQINDVIHEQKGSIPLEQSILLNALKQSEEEIHAKVEIHSSLLQPVKTKNIDTVRALLGKGQVNINEQDNLFGNTLLIWAAKNKDYKMTQLLLDYGANPNISNFKNVTALEFAMEGGDDEIAILLMNASENYNDFS